MTMMMIRGHRSFTPLMVFNKIVQEFKFFSGGSRGKVQGVRTPPNSPPPHEMTCGFLIQLVFCEKKKTMWFIGVEVEQETSAPLLEKILDPPLFFF